MAGETERGVQEPSVLTMIDMTDPYTSTNRCVDRLFAVWAKHGRCILAVDYDDSVHAFRDQTDTHDRAHGLLRRAKDLNCLIILFTAGEPARYPDMIAYMTAHGFVPDSINETPKDLRLSVGNHGKPYYNLLLDDKAGLGQALDILEWTLDRIDAARDLNG